MPSITADLSPEKGADELWSCQCEALLRQHLNPGMTLGLVGVGRLGSRLRSVAENMGSSVLLCDPPRNREEVEELKDRFFALWGNGMGGCQLTGEELETFLPLDCLKRADVIAIQVPLTKEGPFPTCHMISPAFLQQAAPQQKILCFSDPQVLDPKILNHPRVICSSLASPQKNSCC